MEREGVMSDEMSLEQATEILKIDCAGSGEDCSGCPLLGTWKTTECVDMVMRAHQIVIDDYQRREKEAREAALTLADSYIGMNHRLHDYAEFVYATDIEDDEEFAFALATLEKFAVTAREDENGGEG